VKSLDPKKVAEAMHSGMTFHTAVGNISYDKSGDLTTIEFVWFVWKKGDDGRITYKQTSDPNCCQKTGDCPRADCPK